MIKLISFSYRRAPPADANVVVDCRGFRNPFTIPALRELTGKDARVQTFMQTDHNFMARLNQLLSKPLDGRTIACGCHGGKHRSVSMIEMLAHALRAIGSEVVVEHMELA